MKKWLQCIPSWFLVVWLGLFVASFWMGWQMKPQPGKEMRLFFKLWNAQGNEVSGAKVVKRNGILQDSPQTLPSPLLGVQNRSETLTTRLKSGEEVEFSIIWKSASEFRQWFENDFSKRQSGDRWSEVLKAIQLSINEKTNSYTYPLIIGD